ALSWFIFLVPKKYNYAYTFAILIILWVGSSKLAIQMLTSGLPLKIELLSNFYFNPLNIVIDSISAYFILIINLTALSSFLFAKGYLKPYLKEKSKLSFSLHYFNFFLLNFSMLFVVMLRDAIGFLLVWELMSLSSFFLVIFDHKKVETLKTGVRYLLQMHIGYLFLIAGFVTVFVFTGVFGFDGLEKLNNSIVFFNLPISFWIFILFFIGFGIKAGFFPLHTWLPHAHPAAPSHVSGLMSGVMIKMGIYGIIRFLWLLPKADIYIGVFIFIISIITGIFGVMSAILQHDLKKLLAYHSIENIGIIGIGIGVGVLGAVYNMPILSFLGWAGALLHILNHSLFKSLLFYSAGSVYLKTHTRNINKLGGIIKKMPFTAFVFLIAAIAISGIPPFNGFISEFLIYNGLFNGLKNAQIGFAILMVFGIIGLVLIGGMALFCFTKVFGIVFLGFPRSPFAEKATKVSPVIKISNLIPLLLIIIIGIVPIYFFRGIVVVLKPYFKTLNYSQLYISNSFLNIGLISAIIIVTVSIFYVIRTLLLKNKKVAHEPTWGCGYTGANPALNQYNATSFAANFKRIVKPAFVDLSNEINYADDELFPAEKKYNSHVEDKAEHKILLPISNFLIEKIKKLAVLQTGKLQDYLLYPLLFILLVTLLTVLKIL
ncbi:MAG: proton-conducting transporter transmembrane domain-containing protein, partial [Lutibacter sp.]